MSDQLIGHLIPGMVVVFKPDPKNKYAVTVGIVTHIFDVTTPKPQFAIDLVLGSCSDPAFIHHYTQHQNVKNIEQVCVCGICVWCVCVVCVFGVCVCGVCVCGVCVCVRCVCVCVCVVCVCVWCVCGVCVWCVCIIKY